jgi:hypothetical protein
MTDDRRRPPPRFPRPPSDPDEIFIPPADTERSPILPPAPRVPEPFRVLKGRESSYVELSAQIGEVLSVQRKMALQLDGYGKTVNDRFDIFHRELALLRATVVGDHSPRLDAVEKTAAQKARGMALTGTKYGAYLTGAAVLAKLVGKAYPQFGGVIDELLAAVGL